MQPELWWLQYLFFQRMGVQLATCSKPVDLTFERNVYKQKRWKVRCDGNAIRGTGKHNKNARGRDKRKSVLEGTGNRRNVHRHVQKMPQQRQTLKPIILRIPKLANANITSCDCICFPLQMWFAEFSGAYKCFCVFFLRFVPDFGSNFVLG